MKKSKHFLALVPMGGQSLGKIAQHSIEVENMEDAVAWARGRFNRSCVVVEMLEGEDSLPLNGNVGSRNIFMISK